MAPKLEKGGHVVFVCMGNIHRSPLAAAMFKARVEARGFPCIVESAGIIDVGSKPAASEWATHKFAKTFDLSAHRSRHISAVKYTPETFFVCADTLILLDVSRLDGISEERVLPLNSFCGVCDPQYHGYDTCFTQIHTGIAMLVEKLGIGL